MTPIINLWPLWLLSAVCLDGEWALKGDSHEILGLCLNGKFQPWKVENPTQTLEWIQRMLTLPCVFYLNKETNQLERIQSTANSRWASYLNNPVWQISNMAMNVHFYDEKITNRLYEYLGTLTKIYPKTTTSNGETTINGTLLNINLADENLMSNLRATFEKEPFYMLEPADLPRMTQFCFPKSRCIVMGPRQEDIIEMWTVKGHSTIHKFHVNNFTHVLDLTPKNLLFNYCFGWEL